MTGIKFMVYFNMPILEEEVYQYLNINLPTGLDWIIKDNYILGITYNKNDYPKFARLLGEIFAELGHYDDF
jgi:hypothetical protein